MDQIESIKSLAQTGIIGVCLSLIWAIIYIMKAFLKFMGEHFDENTKAINSLKEIIDRKLN